MAPRRRARRAVPAAGTNPDLSCIAGRPGAERRVLRVARLGLVDYQEAWDLQRRLAEARRHDRIGDVMLLLEHPHTYTLGRRGKHEHVLLTRQQLQRKNITLYEVDRGGDVTYHGPGQLVGYPIFKLPGTRLDRVGYLRDLEMALLQAVRSLRIDAGLRAGLSGVWVADDKICALGAKIDAHGITTHGFALNVNTDLEYFQLIVPCGITGELVTSLEHETGAQMNLDDVARSAAGHFAQVFASDVQWVDTLDALLGRSVGVPMQPPAELRKLRGDDEIFRA